MNNTQVAHLWASGSKASGKGSNFYFEGGTIFSYGSHFPIARRITEGFYLITEKGYSNSTSRHISYTRKAIPSFAKLFSVENRPDSSFETIREEKMKQAWRKLVNVDGQNPFATYENAQSLSVFARDTLDLFTWIKREGDETFNFWDQAKELSEIIGKAELEKEKNREGYEIALTKQQAQKEAREAKQQAKYERQRELDKMEALQLVELWRSGESVPTWKFRYLPPMLRIKGDKVQTSQGAEVSLEDARKAFSFIIRIINIGKEWKRNGETCQVGAFSLVSIDCAFVTIGCHKFTIEEVKDFGKII